MVLIHRRTKRFLIGTVLVSTVLTFTTLLLALDAGEFKYKEGYRDCGLYQLQHTGRNCPVV